jgi:hypothetical protein
MMTVGQSISAIPAAASKKEVGSGVKAKLPVNVPTIAPESLIPLAIVLKLPGTSMAAKTPFVST